MIDVFLAPFVALAGAIAVIAVVFGLLVGIRELTAYLIEHDRAPRLVEHLDALHAHLWSWSFLPPVLLAELLPLRARVLLVRLFFAMGDDAPSLPLHWFGLLAAKIACPTTCPRCGQRCGTVEILLGDRGPRPLRACIRCVITTQAAEIREAINDCVRARRASSSPPSVARGAS